MFLHNKIIYEAFADAGWEDADNDDEAAHDGAMQDQQQPHEPSTGDAIMWYAWPCHSCTTTTEVSMDVLNLLFQLAIPQRVCIMPLKTSLGLYFVLFADCTARDGH